MFAMSYILIGKRKPANLQAFFMPKLSHRYSGCHPVWSVNAPTAYEV